MQDIEKLKRTFVEKKVLSLSDVKKTLGTSARITAIRKCKKLGTVTSYSHKGSYYVLPTTPSYDKHGIWNINDIWFSANGTLLKTISWLVQHSEVGYFSHELDELLHVRTGNSLTSLFVQKYLYRLQVNSRYLYLWPSQKDVQLKARKIKLSKKGIPGYENKEMELPLTLFLSVLNEKQKRLFLGFESMRYGLGGDYAIATLTGVNRKTIGKGRRELERGYVNAERIRDIGAGRGELKKKKY
ncbi:MAG: hypothetical protein D8M57_18930 [Candidatus Scalindua sp. AMX11]|nr:MAG: hypothetical protein DWQ00_08885 [Candidatus Scalindua sp.]NOG84079.1 hypothetical protein [Planctomycetota bacterium]RZV62394.1 MAG: hypothetical protein EX341_18570 [Candidatus Scalindua sp. SCAELEC01]TDE63314.1 MAG: hypothetical protein D8M57_18930 [Candidatus Scalindua sp. AMX11]GJQ57525.1 MAG: hypothetical protein SCALA701_03260 [Candidatus Scalindua sp.]